ncbi:MAG: hypothetical protein GY778_19090 [bacterium]|nr:hypothetical protein [bacterium]
MTPVLEWLLGLERIRLGSDQALSLQWRAPFPAWVVLGFSLLVAALIVLLCRREMMTGNGKRRRRWVSLSLLRGALAAVVIALLCRPALVLRRERLEPSWVALLVDTSHSMARQERYRTPALAAAVADGAGLGDPQDTGGFSRLELVRRALLADSAGALGEILGAHQIRLITFADRSQVHGMFDLVAEGENGDGVEALASALTELQADGTGTDLPGALTELLVGETVPQIGRLTGVVLATDGQSTTGSDLSAAMHQARTSRIPVLALRVGSPHAPQDLTVGPLVAEENVYVDDLVAIEATVNAAGLESITSVPFRLIDESEQTIIATQSVALTPGDSTTRVEFQVKPQRTGKVAYRIEADPLPVEDETDDNADRIEIEVRDQHLRVLYVEDSPRFEYRYLKNVLLREATIRSSILLLSADTSFAQEGTDPIRRFPETAEEMDRYDVVIFGDVDPAGDWLSAAQARLLVDFVDRGGGFALIAGPQHAPHRFRGTLLERLVPVYIDPDFAGRYESYLADWFHPRLTAEGRQARCFRFDRDPQVSRQLFDSLPGFYWIARTRGPRPAAEVLAEHPTWTNRGSTIRPGDRPGGEGLPLFVAGRYGAGKVFFAATDDTWRWRRHTGEFLHDAYWVQLCRMLARGGDLDRDRRLHIATDRRNYVYGDRVEVRVEVRDAELLASLDASIGLTLLDARSVPQAKFKADRVDPTSNVFEAAFVAARTGSLTLRCEAVVTAFGQSPASSTIRIAPADLETRRPEADHSMLNRLAEQTGGAVLDLNQLDRIPAMLPDRSARIPDDITEPLWDSRLALILFVTLITAEWILRKGLGML